MKMVRTIEAVETTGSNEGNKDYSDDSDTKIVQNLIRIFNNVEQRLLETILSVLILDLSAKFL